MDDFTKADMPDEVPEPIKRLLEAFGMGPAPDPAEVRAHEMGHFTDDLGIDQDKAVRILDIANSAVRALPVSETPSGDALVDHIIRMSMAAAIESQVRHTFGAIHFAEERGVPVDAVINMDSMRECFDGFLAAWDRVVVDSAEVIVPDDISSLVE